MVRLARNDGSGVDAAAGAADSGRAAAPRLGCGGKRAGGGRCAARDGGGELAGLPELEEVFEAGEEAGQDGGDQCVQGGGRVSPTSPRRGVGAHLGAEAGGPGWFE